MNKYILILFVLIVLASNVYATQINSSTYKQIVTVSAGGDKVGNSTYTTYTAAGIINKIINSSSYLNKLGFFYTWLLANDQPCTLDSQCEGGYCCSSLCSSSSCPTTSPGTGGGGTAGGGGGGGGGSGFAYVCNEDWECGDWSDCENGLQTRQCELQKVPQRAQEAPCASSDNPPESSRSCETEFGVSPGAIKEHLKLGASKIQKIRIKNPSSSPVSFDLNVETLDDFVFLSDTSFTLEGFQEKEIEMSIVGRKLGSYFGELQVVGNGAKKAISIVIEVESEQVLFDAKIDIPAGNKVVAPGGDLRAQITLLNVGPPRKVDVTTTFIIKDRRGAVLYESSETFAVEKQTSFVKVFKVPPSLQPDDYLAVIEVRYENSFAVSSDLFKVAKEGKVLPKSFNLNQVLLVSLFVFVVLLSFVTYSLVSKRISKNKK